MWGYRHENITKEFDTREELVDYLERMDSDTLRNVRYWYIEECFDTQDLIRDLVDGDYKDYSREDWQDMAFDEIEMLFSDGEYDWSDETICGIYYKEEVKE